MYQVVVASLQVKLAKAIFSVYIEHFVGFIEHLL